MNGTSLQWHMMLLWQSISNDMTSVLEEGNVNYNLESLVVFSSVPLRNHLDDEEWVQLHDEWL